MAMLGDLSEFSLSDILQMFERAAKTGQLSIWAPTGIHRIWFYQGRVITALSPDKQKHLRRSAVVTSFLRARGLFEYKQTERKVFRLACKRM